MVVHQVVGFRVVLDERDAQVLDLVGYRLLASDAHILLDLGRGDPDRPLAAARDRVQGCGEASGSSGIGSLARLRARGRSAGPPVSDDEVALLEAIYTPSSLAKNSCCRASGVGSGSARAHAPCRVATHLAGEVGVFEGFTQAEAASGMVSMRMPPP